MSKIMTGRAIADTTYDGSGISPRNLGPDKYGGDPTIGPSALGGPSSIAEGIVFNSANSTSPNAAKTDDDEDD